MSSDSSDEDENLQQLKEACDSQFINDSMYKPNAQKAVKASDEPQPESLRRCKDEDEQFNLFRVTPEFRKHVAKHLTKILDEVLQDKIKKVDSNDDESCSKKKSKGGVKLFRDSSKYLKVEKLLEAQHKNSEYLSNGNYSKRRKVSEVEDEELHYEQCKCVAQSPDYIANKTETKSWSNRSKAQVFKYKKTPQGCLVETT